MFSRKIPMLLWVHFQFIRESMTMSRYKESPKGIAEQERAFWEGRSLFPPNLNRVE